MLVLQRRMDEKIVILVPGLQPITIMVVNVNSLRQVKIGIDAPKNVVVHREEVLEKIRQQP